ncbi:MAG: dihydroorotate dehydrogenase electron transfer subunit, partial [Methanosarcinales archaeon]
MTKEIIDYPHGVEIKEIILETHDVKTFVLNYSLNAKLGQFVMIWIPRVDEKPFTITQSDPLAITVKKRGKATQTLHSMEEGDILGVRGPYGDGVFSLNSSAMKKIMLVGGGYGTASLKILAETAVMQNIEVDAIIGADTKKNLLFVDHFKNIGAKVTITTDDGSLGIKDFTTFALLDKLQNQNYDAIYTCGPEIMMSKVLKIAEKYNIEVQASLEAYMKCGFGICGHCALDPLGLRVCKDGPVFSSDILKKIDGFGYNTRDKSGR